jgi:hypothetical protein
MKWVLLRMSLLLICNRVVRLYDPYVVHFSMSMRSTVSYAKFHEL